ncbi:MAG: hypothetical protein JXR94_05465, partial [Candidatus Hydrogenedentes bacterium]|nr:hypothetical protein [Candidatus Hydrogenedentota bacterium]
GRSRTIALLEGVKLAGVVAIGLWAAPRYGVLGMAWTLAAVKSTIGVGTVIAAHVGISRMARGVDRPGNEGGHRQS